MRAAYYSRNNSYSRSLNAEIAESENRYPLTRAAAHLGITPTAFKKGLSHSGITTAEWHHVGKYANKVDYYDVSDSSEIVMSKLFWEGASNKTNVNHCANARREALRRLAQISLKEKMRKWYMLPMKRYVIHGYDGWVKDIEPIADFTPYIFKKILSDLSNRPTKHQEEEKINGYYKYIGLQTRGNITNARTGQIIPLGELATFPINWNFYEPTHISGYGRTVYFKLTNEAYNNLSAS